MLRLLGAALLVAACGGGGGLLWQNKLDAWCQVRAFADLLEYLEAAIRYQATPCTVLLCSAAQDPRFAILRWQASVQQGFADIPVPAALGSPLVQQARQAMQELGTAPQQRACELLAGLLAACRTAQAEALRAAQEAGRLYPKLGVCAGILLVLFLL